MIETILAFTLFGIVVCGVVTTLALFEIEDIIVDYLRKRR